jgi:hypothetical protein
MLFPIPNSMKLLIATAMLLAAMLLVPEAQSEERREGHHGIGHDALHSWYQTLTDKAGRSCCSSVDCRPTSSREVKGGVEVLVDGSWTPVPEEKILETVSPDLGTHVCSPLQPSPYPKGHVFCVVLGSGA